MCVGVVGLKDVEEAMDICLGGAYYEVELVRCPSWFFGLSEDVHKVFVLFGDHFVFSFEVVWYDI